MSLEDEINEDYKEVNVEKKKIQRIECGGSKVGLNMALGKNLYLKLAGEPRHYTLKIEALT